MKKWIFIGLVFFLTGCDEELTHEMLMTKIETSNPSGLSDLIADGSNRSESLDSTALILMSMASLKNKDNLNTELFLYKASLRAAVDKAVFPPIETGGNSPLLLLMALRQQISAAIFAAPQKSSEQYQLMIDSINDWKPICEEKYNPGWEYNAIPDYELCQAKIIELIDKNVNIMNQQKAFYAHPEYYSLLKQWQDLHVRSLYSQSTEPNNELINLQNKLFNIEKELGVKGEISQYIELSQKLQ